VIAARITFEHACNDCAHHGTGPTAAHVQGCALAHAAMTGHRVVIATWNGWHRP
jgi:hypothetical protein